MWFLLLLLKLVLLPRPPKMKLALLLMPKMKLVLLLLPKMKPVFLPKM